MSSEPICSRMLEICIHPSSDPGATGGSADGSAARARGPCGQGGDLATIRATVIADENAAGQHPLGGAGHRALEVPHPPRCECFRRSFRGSDPVRNRGGRGGSERRRNVPKGRPVCPARTRNHPNWAIRFFLPRSYAADDSYRISTA
ncbi:hypothetical protein IFM12276_24910 [Nocardia sputorum]|uniref:Uncharacterized protein n=1 Tax=Nocardia sputorum TaxID=2984338 RepID=A0ABM8CWU3_9NOCA|nr:hypothetical protein IFM12276_24910 [Nocardia sputorum]